MILRRTLLFEKQSPGGDNGYKQVGMIFKKRIESIGGGSLTIRGYCDPTCYVISNFVGDIGIRFYNRDSRYAKICNADKVIELIFDNKYKDIILSPDDLPIYYISASRLRNQKTIKVTNYRLVSYLEYTKAEHERRKKQQEEREWKQLEAKYGTPYQCSFDVSGISEALGIDKHDFNIDNYL